MALTFSYKRYPTLGNAFLIFDKKDGHFISVWFGFSLSQRRSSLFAANYFLLLEKKIK